MAHHERMLRGGIDRELAIGVVVGDGDVRFHRVGVDHRKIKLAFHDVRCRSEGGVDVTPFHMHVLANIFCAAREISEIVEPPKGAAEIVRPMNEHSAGRERGIDVEHRRELFVIDFDFVERLLRAQFIFGDDRGYRLADESNLADRQQGMIFYGVAIIRMQRTEVISRKHVDDSGLTLGLGNVDGENFGMRKRAAEKFGPSHALERNVAGVGSGPRNLGHAIGARDGMIHNGKILCVAFLRVTHRFVSFVSRKFVIPKRPA